MQRQPVAQVPHDVVAVRPEADDDRSGPVHQEPDRHRRLLLQLARVPDEINRRQWPQGVGDIVGAVRERRRGRGEHLEERIQMLGLIVIVRGPGMHALEVAAEEARTRAVASLLPDNVPIHAAENVVFRSDEQIARGIPRSHHHRRATGSVAGFGRGVDRTRGFRRQSAGSVLAVDGS